MSELREETLTQYSILDSEYTGHDYEIQSLLAKTSSNAC
jgi:hypothetical protein